MLPGIIAWAAVVASGGCFAPAKRLAFPPAPAALAGDRRLYDVDGDGRIDFALDCGPSGRIERLLYDDDEDGTFDRSFRLDAYEPDRLPHLIILLDSIPFETVASFYERGGLGAFDPPQKVIPPFPTMSGVIFSELLRAPPMPAANNRAYDPRTNAVENGIVRRAVGRGNAWESRLHYRTNYWENGWSFLQPRSWYAAELPRIKAALDESPDRITLAYVASTAGMLSRHGRDGLEEILVQLETLCLELLYERRGALAITVISDHGHNLRPAQRISLDDSLIAAGFRIASRIRDGRDVVYDMDGLVNYLGMHTRDAAGVADALAGRPELELVMYQQGDEVVIRDAEGLATVAARHGRSRYRPVTADVLDYAPLLERFESAGLVDADGFVADDDWFEATVDHRWPDVPRRVWWAFHGLTVNVPQAMVTFRDGYCTGLDSMDLFIDMASTHGGLDQDDSATFVMTTTGRARRPMRTEDVLRIVEPRYDPNARPGR